MNSVESAALLITWQRSGKKVTAENYVEFHKAKRQGVVDLEKSCSLKICFSKDLSAMALFPFSSMRFNTFIVCIASDASLHGH